MRTPAAILLLLSVLLSSGVWGCEKNVQEVRRKDTLAPEARPYSAQTASHREVPEAPRGEPAGITNPPATP